MSLNLRKLAAYRILSCVERLQNIGFVNHSSHITATTKFISNYKKKTKNISRQYNMSVSIDKLQKFNYFPTFKKKEEFDKYKYTIAKMIEIDDNINNVNLVGNEFLMQIDYKLFIESVYETIITHKEDFGFNAPLNNYSLVNGVYKSRQYKNVCIEYSSPNIAKRFHYGHFRSTMIGHVLANIYELLHDNVVRLNYYGDWGMQMGILLSNVDEKIFEKSADEILCTLNRIYSEKSNNITLETKQKALNSIMKLEQGDLKLTSIWQKLKNISIQEYENTYKLLDVQFCDSEYESNYDKESKIMTDYLFDKGIAKKNEYGTYVKNEDKNILLKRKDGTSLYIARDLAAYFTRKDKYKSYQFVYVTESGQYEHFTKLKKLINLIEPTTETFDHLMFGRIHKLSSRKGSDVLLETILSKITWQVIDRLKSNKNTRLEPKEYETIGSKIAIAVLLINDLKRPIKQDYEFDIDAVINNIKSGKCGMAILLCHARLFKLEEKFGQEYNSYQRTTILGPLGNETSYNLILHIAAFEDIISETYQSMDPSKLVNYLLEFTKRVNENLSVQHLAKGSKDFVLPHFVLFMASKRILSTGLQILGIEPLKNI